MSVETIFRQLHDPRTWPAPPERHLVPADLSRLAAAAKTATAGHSGTLDAPPSDQDDERYARFPAVGRGGSIWRLRGYETEKDGLRSASQLCSGKLTACCGCFSGLTKR